MQSTNTSPDFRTRRALYISATTLLLALTPALAYATNITYAVNPVAMSSGTQVSGTITTDGTVGPLTTENFVDCQINVDYRPAEPSLPVLPFIPYTKSRTAAQFLHLVATPSSLTLEPPIDGVATLDFFTHDPDDTIGLHFAVVHQLYWTAPTPLPDVAGIVGTRVGMTNTNYGNEDFFSPPPVVFFEDWGLLFNFPLELARVSILQAGDADQDFDFDQLDLVRVQIAAKYLTGEAATWGDGDWNAAPGGSQGNPPAGDGLFNQLDIVAAQQAGTYLTGPYAAVQPNGQQDDSQTSMVHNVGTGELAGDALGGEELMSMAIASAAGILNGDVGQNLGGRFADEIRTDIVNARFGNPFGSLTFGHGAPTGLSDVQNDFTASGSPQGGGELGDLDLIPIPEPSSVVLLSLGSVVIAARGRRQAIRT